ncbi:MAG: DUF1549 domain-containing protein, partial [Planctomycetaceae bacterium]|nr:DUF1549 domain-containing protein [Planctomycetaceae bacterium]
MRLIVAIATLFALLQPLDAVRGADPAAIDFAHEVVPILRQHCIECHAGSEAKGGMSLNSRSTLLDAAAVVPGRADESRLLELVRSADPDEQMPPQDRNRLSDEEVATLRRWIEAGAPWEDGFTFDASRYEPPLIPRKVELPPPQDGRTNPIDRILDTYLAERSISPGEPVDDPTFMRRLSLDLVGLLPKAEELQSFV